MKRNTIIILAAVLLSGLAAGSNALDVTHTKEVTKLRMSNGAVRLNRSRKKFWFSPVREMESAAIQPNWNSVTTLFIRRYIGHTAPGRKKACPN